MEKREKIAVAVIIVLILLGIGLIKGKEYHDSRAVDFADETMGQVLYNSCKNNYLGDKLKMEDVTYNVLKELKLGIEIGYIGYYETIIDLKYCRGADKLFVNTELWKSADAYFINEGEINRKVSEEEVEKAQEELGKILPKMKELSWLSIGGAGGVEWTSVDFLKNQKSIEDLEIYNCKATDYSVLKTCKSLKSILIEYSQLSKAEDLIGLDNVEHFYLRETPLAENPEEIKKLQEAYPEADIYY